MYRYTKEGNEIFISRGDSADQFFILGDQLPSAENGDRVVFAVKDTVENDTPLIEKELPILPPEDGNEETCLVHLRFDPQDTVPLRFKTYKWGLRIFWNGGEDVSTLIDVASFVVGPVVPNNEEDGEEP